MKKKLNTYGEDGKIGVREKRGLNAEFAEEAQRALRRGRVTQEHSPFGKTQGKREWLCHREVQQDRGWRLWWIWVERFTAQKREQSSRTPN
jgi:hypothetical protein